MSGFYAVSHLSINRNFKIKGKDYEEKVKHKETLV